MTETRFTHTVESIVEGVAELALRAVVGEGLLSRVFHADDLLGLTFDADGRVIPRPGFVPPRTTRSTFRPARDP
jgi:hypothetical protein